MTRLLFSPITINGMTVRNRLFMAPMGLAYTNDSHINRRIIDFFAERAKGGVGLIDVGACRIHELAGGPVFIGLDDDAFIPGLKALTAEVHKHGAKIIPQLYHPGSSIHAVMMPGKQPISSSPVRSPFSGQMPRPLSLDEIPGLQQSYVDAALRAKKAGFDGIDIIGAAGYLISQFLSPIRNLREDRYGGSFENRLRFALEIVEQTRAAVGKDFPIFFKMAVIEFMIGGHGLKEGQAVARELENAGVDGLIAAGGWHETRVPQIARCVPENTWLYLARKLKDVVRIPVITCNQIRDPRVAEEILQDGIADMVGMGRPFLADPHYANKAKEGRFSDINHCVSCLQGCFGTEDPLGGVTCLVNPGVGREYEIEIKPVERSKKVMIIGGGPAGLEAARILSLRGHEVSLHEQHGILGGQLPIAAAPRGREPFQRFANYLATQVEKQGVKVFLNSRMSVDEIVGARPDAVVLATGAVPVRPAIPGVDLPHVHQAWDVLMGRVPLGQKIVVVGGGPTGCEVALFLAEKGTLSPEALHYLFLQQAEDLETLRDLLTRGTKQVTLVEMLPKIGRGIGSATRWTVLSDLKRYGVRTITQATLKAIHKTDVLILREGVEERLPCDTVVLALGVQPQNQWEEQIRDRGIREVYVIGDAQKPRKALEAVREGFDVGMKI